MPPSPDNLSIVEHLAVLVVVDNTAARSDLATEHGLAVWIEADSHRVLLDTGQGPALAPNADRLAVPLEGAEAVALSHGHWDHTGGLPTVLDRAPGARICLHPAAVEPHYSGRPSGPAAPIGMPPEAAAMLRRAGDRVCWTDGPTEVVPGVWVTGPVPRQTAFEDVGGPFFLDAACTRPDPMADDQSVYVRTPKGVVVLCGCAHAGIVNTLDYVGKLTGETGVHAVLGGLHLGGAGAERLERTAEAFERRGVEVLAPGHCTGEAAAAFFRRRLGERCVPFGAGTWFALA